MDEFESTTINLSKEEFLLELMEYVLQSEPVTIEDAYNDFSILPCSMLFNNTFSGFIRFLQKYSSIFTLTVDGYIHVSTGTKGGSANYTTTRTAIEFFKDILLRSPNGKCRLNSLFGHRSQATVKVKEQIGKTEMTFKKFLLGHPHDFLILGDYVCLADLNNRKAGSQQKQVITHCESDASLSDLIEEKSLNQNGDVSIDISGHQSGVVYSLQPSYGFVSISGVFCYFTRENVCDGLTGINSSGCGTTQPSDLAECKTDLEEYFTVNEKVDCIVMRANGACPWRAVQISKVERAGSAVSGSEIPARLDVMDAEVEAYSALLNLHDLSGEVSVVKVISQCFSLMPNLRGYLANELRKPAPLPAVTSPRSNGVGGGGESGRDGVTPPVVTNIIIRDSDDVSSVTSGQPPQPVTNNNKPQLTLDIRDVDKASSSGDSDLGEEDTDECYSSRTNDSSAPAADIALDQEPELKNISGVIKVIHHSYGIVGFCTSDCYFTKMAVVELSGLPRKQRKISLTRVFQLGDRVCCNAVVAEDASRAKWRALQVWRAPT